MDRQFNIMQVTDQYKLYLERNNLDEKLMTPDQQYWLRRTFLMAWSQASITIRSQMERGPFLLSSVEVHQMVQGFEIQSASLLELMPSAAQAN